MTYSSVGAAARSLTPATRVASLRRRLQSNLGSDHPGITRARRACSERVPRACLTALLGEYARAQSWINTRPGRLAPQNKQTGPRTRRTDFLKRETFLNRRKKVEAKYITAQTKVPKRVPGLKGTWCIIGLWHSPRRSYARRGSGRGSDASASVRVTAIGAAVAVNR
jgi:hypothetical protein